MYVQLLHVAVKFRVQLLYATACPCATGHAQVGYSALPGVTLHRLGFVTAVTCELL